MRANILRTATWLTMALTLALLISCGGGHDTPTPNPTPTPSPPTSGDESSSSNPLNLGTVGPTVYHAGSVSTAGSSYYKFTTDACGGQYTIGLTNTHSDLGWYLYESPGFTIGTSIFSCDSYSTAVDEICTIWSSSPLIPNATYYIKVVEWDLTSDTYTLTITPPASPAAPSAPTGVTITAGNAKVRINWTEVSGATSYNIYRSTTSGEGTSGTKVGNVSAPPFFDMTVTPGITYYYVVTALVTCSEGPASSPDVPAVPLVAASTLLSTNFDDGTLQGWTAVTTGTEPVNTVWGVTNAVSHSGSYCAADSPGGNYSYNNKTTLTSPVLSLSTATLPTLSFYHRYDIETDWDYGYVEVSTDGGTSWNTIRTYSGSDTLALTTFTPVTLDLSAFKGYSSVVIRFRLITDFFMNKDGWYIDDIVVSP